MPRAAAALPVRLSPRLAAIALLALAPGAATAQLVRSGAGATSGDLLPVVEQFRADLGGALNPNVPGSFADGRREINWDGVPAALSAPNQLPANFFNVNSPRGVVFSTPGTGFQVSANAGEGPVEFGNLNPGYPDQFTTFSPQKLFTALASNTMDVSFFVPGTTTPASVRGFGAVFTDVDVADATSLAFFGAGDELLGTFFAPPLNNGLSFLGVSFTSVLITRVRITTGTAALGPDEA
ncbi:MAG TPA: hypothetical protein VF048_01965, partial [Gemmatimonadaceae bacterium]